MDLENNKPASADALGEENEKDIIHTIKDEELIALLRRKRLDGRGQPRTSHDERGKRIDGYTHTTIIAKTETLNKIRAIALANTLTQKVIYNLALDEYVARYEAQHGVITPRVGGYDGIINDKKRKEDK